MWKGQLPVFTASKQMSGWARRVTIVGEVQGIEDEDERKKPPNWYLSKCQTWKRPNFVKCYFRALRKLFIVVVLLHTRERSRCLYHWNFALQIIYKILLLHAHLRTNTICIQNRTVYKFNGVILDMTHCSWCNPQGPEKLYFKATSIPLEILLALPSKYIQNLGSSSGKRNIRPTIKLGSTSRNEEHWKWNQARLAMNDSSKSLDAFISGSISSSTEEP
ncbi:uncharacterized protein LOC121030780 [Herpailurus yagouaroundi]|uniref:uncharacterized protein LOC121030780 n=1 Tax=Herpailurus yagouaroundi TaxID=1608482 RepID=UPI001AD6BF1A|nr:uncharacterized protein LOC121030780 [Puma yagouaroundi]